jgi:predicted nucleic-acid-binding protein
MLKKTNLHILDANTIIRYVTNDDEQKSSAVEKLLQSSKKCYLSSVVIAEIVWVLSSYYKKRRAFIADVLLRLISLSSIVCEKPLILTTLSLYKDFKIDWIDCFIVAQHLSIPQSVICSYDRDFDKLENVKRIEP